MRRFAYRLARELKVVDVDRMLRGLPSSKFFEWMAFEAVEPFEDRRGDLRAAVVVQTLLNIHRDPKRPAVELSKVLETYFGFEPRVPTRTQTMAEQRRIFEAISKALARNPRKAK